jgi:hypothetical protein
MPENDQSAYEINPGEYMSDPDYSPESWASMNVDEYMIAIGNCGRDLACVREVLSRMPQDVYEEYAVMNYPELPTELRPDYRDVAEEDEEG